MSFSEVLYAFIALVFVLALFAVLALMARRMGFGFPVAAKGSRKRLSVVEALPLDAKRRLVLLKLDATEHLVLVGPSSELLIAGSIPAAPSNGPDNAPPEPVVDKI